ncbi:MAG: hypothetical protein JSU87_10805 [Gemmatimonadota bacterium]|nr:MAG: hypothetical protein JSU87_10805 [Gemmatimonadota bacterium]
MQVLPVDVTSVIGVIMGSLIVLIPIAGVTLRFAIKPIAEAMARIRESQSESQQFGLMQQRVDLLERQVSVLESEMHRLREVQDFHAQLQEPKD